MKNKVLDTIKKYNLINENDKVLVGVSGGPDSISLLNILFELGYHVCVAHLNHGLRENAILDENYVLNFCRIKNIPCFVKKIDLRENLGGMTLEEAGRKERYDFFYEIMQKEGCTKIATAHNSNDSAETVFMNIIRGSGVNGLKGILPIAKMNTSDENKRLESQDNCSPYIIRPLIECNRKEIEDYCLENNLNPRHDESNDEPIYTRNKIRLELIPYIEKNINSNIIKNINRLSEIVAEEENFISRQVDVAYHECIMEETKEKVVCNLKIFNKLDIVIKKRLIIKFIIKVLGNAKDIEKVHIEDILKLCENNVGGKYLTPNKHIKVFVNKSKVEYIAI
ncbi:MAG: tRNA lysidine(34) synthetase TilS [Clostridia bacterium]|nr:tRNA lysidine(34) synthetase TilS [Clostridia bacterium]